MTHGWDRREAGWFLLAMAWLALTLGVRPLTLPDEGRYVSVAWEMVTSGDWLCPTLNGLPFFHKPPLFYWITAASLRAFGLHEWAARLVSWLGAGVAAYTLFGFALRQGGRVVARWTLLILVTLPIIFGSAQFANLDMLVAGFISATIVLAAEAALEAQAGRPYRKWLAGSYLCAALGVLSKGLIGAALPGLAILAWLAWNRRLGQLRTLLWLPGLALFALVAVPWFAAMQARYPGFFHYFFVYQQFQRYAAGGYNNPQPVWFYVPVVVVGMLPWSVWLIAGLRERAVTADHARAVRSLMWLWPAAIAAFFSIPASKLLGYILPAVPPLAYLTADALHRRLGGADALPRRLQWSAAIAAAICLGLVVTYNVAIKKSDKALSRAVASARRPGEPLIFLNDQFFDVPFYLGLREPVTIVAGWDRPDIGKKDDWRKALLDAAEFDPATARKVLLTPAQLPGMLCGHPVSWIMAKSRAAESSAYLHGAAPLATQEETSVWRVSAQDLAARGLCPQTPSDGSAGRSAPPPTTG